jgi:predicted DsbA family dithiol-disulfide isomerase
MLEIEFWSDLHCPWSHVAAIRLRRALAQLDTPTRVHWRCWPLELVNHNGTPRTTIETERPVLAQLEPDAFAPWTRTDYPDTFLPAMAALKCAARQGPEAEDRYDSARRFGFFRDICNLALTDDLLHLAESAGLDMDRLAADFWAGHGHAAVWQDWQDSKTRAIQGSPHLFVVGSDLNVHNPGIQSHDSQFGIPIIDGDDPRFLEGWVRQALEAGTAAGR